jgi:hypothetical protein
MRTVRRIAVVFAVLLLVVVANGCYRPADSRESGKTAKATEAKGGAASVAKNQVAFAPEDFEASLRWIAAQAETVYRTEDQRNKLLLEDRLQAMHAELAKMVGQQVNWQVEVDRVDETSVHLSVYELNKYLATTEYGRIGTLIISGIAESSPSGVLELDGDWHGNSHVRNEHFRPGLEIGRVISKARAKQLAHGDKVRIQGKIAYCVASSRPDYHDWRAFALCLVETKCPD